ncbi:vitelline membrane outer layer protein 1-like [Rhinichthys klamathensis goyatoka]|uniref:vitelline membrane outer layer protein 1-like n=1 Tax=Rhinichthys klamathensis goyatoka TaxID=3034132 RepID=UPI0024B5C9B9|nr:vitelline membrane outer layer protein 1-like [Rhinichthys klamathensis goyatoka]
MAESDRYRWTKSLRNLPEVTYDDVVRMVNENSQVETSKLRKGYKFFWEKFIFDYRAIIGQHVSVQSTGRRSERSINRYPRTPFVVHCAPNDINEMCLQTVKVSNGMDWGWWSSAEICPSGTYAAGFSLRVEPYSDGYWADNTALNGIRLHCINRTSSQRPYEYYSSIQSNIGSWGWWKDLKWCPSGYLTSFQLKVESHQGIEDDTSVNNIRFKCSQGSLLMGDGTKWGDWGHWSPSCKGTGICGIKTRIEKPQGMGDDTALNDVIMYCCD